MKYFYLYIFIIFTFIIFVSYYNCKEGFTNNTKTYILLGDSILKNDAYVLNGNSVENILITRNADVICYAQDHSKIVDVYSQINRIPMEFDSSNTMIFLSVGGNNILTHYVDQNNDMTDTSVLTPMFSSYKNLVKTIQTRLPNVKIILLDIYYPNSTMYKQYHTIIKEWNEMIYNFASDLSNQIYSVMRISRYLTQSDDFSFGIEPSSVGGEKIADLILQSY
jgi:hypothetical protein